MEIPVSDFDLALTLDSGQVFHWESSGAGFVGTIGGQAVYVEQRGKRLEVRDGGARPAGREKLPEIITRYFSLDHPLAEIRASFPDHPVMSAAANYCHGLRIVRQPRWECLATFITSSMKRVAHIRQISQTLRQRYGRRFPIHGRHVHTFPVASQLARATEKELRGCALGYRAKNLLATARLVASGEVDLEELARLSDEDLRKALCALPGVGPKVANCVMLFAYERLHAFPIDVWIERVLRETYFPRGRRMTARQLRDLVETHFGEYGGYAQQYLFHHARTTTPHRLSRGAR